MGRSRGWGAALSGAVGYGVEKEPAPGYLLGLAGWAAQGQAGGFPSWARGEAVWTSTLDPVLQPGSLERWGKSDRPQLWGLEGSHARVPVETAAPSPPSHLSRIQGFQGCECWAVSSALSFTSSGARRCWLRPEDQRQSSEGRGDGRKGRRELSRRGKEGERLEEPTPVLLPPTFRISLC